LPCLLLRLVNQIAVAWRHNLPLLGRQVKPVGLERNVGVGGAGDRTIGVGHQLATVARGDLGRQPEQDIARVANLDRRPGFAQAEALELFCRRELSQMGVAASALVLLAALAARGHPLALGRTVRLRNFGLREGIGLVCWPLPVLIAARLERVALPPVGGFWRIALVVDAGFDLLLRFADVVAQFGDLLVALGAVRFFARAGALPRSLSLTLPVALAVTLAVALAVGAALGVAALRALLSGGALGRLLLQLAHHLVQPGELLLRGKGGIFERGGRREHLCGERTVRRIFRLGDLLGDGP